MSKSRDEQLQDLKNSARDLKRVYDNNKRRIAEVTAEINDKNQQITDIRSELPTLPKSRKTAKTGELERLEHRVRQLEVIVTQQTGKEKNVRQLLFAALRTLRVHSSAGQAAAAAPSDDDDSDDDSGAGVGSRRSSPRSSSRDASAAGPAVPAGAMAVAVPASAQRGSPSPKRGCWPWSRKKSERSRSKSPSWWSKCFSRKNKDGNPPPTGGRRSNTRKLKTRNTYKKRCASRK
jgi:polyhydroxyalkanoate synthesis regulator phasin